MSLLRVCLVVHWLVHPRVCELLPAPPPFRYDVNWLREAELKHGRICMLAICGWLANDNEAMKFPGEAFQGISSLEAHDAMVGAPAAAHTPERAPPPLPRRARSLLRARTHNPHRYAQQARCTIERKVLF